MVPRDEVKGIRFEYSRVFLPGDNNGLAGCFPSQRLEVFCEVEGADVVQDMCFQALQAGVVEGLEVASWIGSIQDRLEIRHR